MVGREGNWAEKGHGFGDDQVAVRLHAQGAGNLNVGQLQVATAAFDAGDLACVQAGDTWPEAGVKPSGAAIARINGDRARARLGQSGQAGTSIVSMPEPASKRTSVDGPAPDKHPQGGRLALGGL